MLCRICELVEKRDALIVYESKDNLAFLDIHPLNEGHVLLIPKEHVPDFYLLQGEKYDSLMRDARLLARKLKAAFKPRKVGMFLLGFEIDHVHVHLVPLHKFFSMDPTGLRRSDKNPLKKPDAMQKAMERIRDAKVT
jgi:histidine triad (HIT) family protein